MTAERHWGNPGYVNQAQNIISTRRTFPSPWPRRLKVVALLAVMAAIGAVVGVYSGWWV